VKLSLNLLSRFVQLNDIEPKNLAERLTLSGLEVSELLEADQDLDKVVAGRILKIVPHPNANKLSLTEVEVPGQILRIVCGAKNIAEGDVVPVALVGAVLPGNQVIRSVNLRGETSEGMICSERELGLSEEQAGIMHLPQDTPLGTPVQELWGGRDVILETEATPNRPDLLSHLGVARQISAILNRPLTPPAVNVAEAEPEAAREMSVAIEAGSGCGRYCARLLRGIRVGPSPLWLRQALTKLGLRSVNNVVDATNYVLLEIGHPLHAFDLERLSGPAIQARRARPGEFLTTLDGQKRALSGGELIIADAERPVALAGIMGGQDSEVGPGTSSLLLEAAWFAPGEVRRTARLAQCASEASYRFERGTDPELGLTLALDRAAQLIQEIAGGTILRGILDAYPVRQEPVCLSLSFLKAEQVLGLPLSPARAASALSRLGFLVEPDPAAGKFSVRVPTFRNDVTIEEDLIEEIAQVLGYDQIPAILPTVTLASPLPDPRREFLRACRTLAAGLGLTEILSYSFMNPQDLDRLGLPPDHGWREAVKIRNPISEETSLLRTSLLPGLLAAVAYNQRRGKDHVYLFEAGAVFHPRPGEKLPAEPVRLGFALAGPRDRLDWRQGKKRPETDLYDLKGMLEGLWQRLHLRSGDGSRHDCAFIPEPFPFLHPSQSLAVTAPDGRTLGWAGALHPQVQESFKLKTTLWLAELEMERLYAYHAPQTALSAFSRFPAAVRDLSLAVQEATLAGDVERVIREAGGGLLVEVLPFDVYRGEGLEPGTKSLAFSLTFQAADRTLLDDEIKSLHARILERVQSEFGARQR